MNAYQGCVQMSDAALVENNESPSTSNGIAMEIVVLGFNSCLGAGFVGSVDMLKLGSQIISKEGRYQSFKVLTASFNGKPFEDSSGRLLNVETEIAALTGLTAILVPGYLCDDNAKYLSTPEIAALAAWIRRQHAMGALVCASCSGVFILGEAGLLDGRRCTTTWWRHDELKARYPRADAIWGAPLIEDQRVVTSGGPLSWIDLCLHIIRSLCGDDAAKLAADFAVVDTAPSTRTVYVPLSHLSAANPFLLEAEHAVRVAGEETVTAQDLARTLGSFGSDTESAIERSHRRDPQAIYRPCTFRNRAPVARNNQLSCEATSCKFRVLGRSELSSSVLSILRHDAWCLPPKSRPSKLVRP
ncbi:DJ-1/PfpI family protein [Methylocystis sp. IM4]|uniref:DJ-1/PfpI family protein n=1 Tax=Methylocystis sp. IM4 TaxID=3136560 RepID=UPI0040535A19